MTIFVFSSKGYIAWLLVLVVIVVDIFTAQNGTYRDLFFGLTLFRTPKVIPCFIAKTVISQIKFCSGVAA